MSGLARGSDREEAARLSGARAPVGAADGKGDSLLMPADRHAPAASVRMLATCGAALDRAAAGMRAGARSAMDVGKCSRMT